MTACVVAPDEWTGSGPAIFLAGGITDCPDWQAEACRIISGGVTVLNPRRPHFPIDDPKEAPRQISWEFRHLHRATVVLFWFPAGSSPQPIALYELGRHAALGRPLAVGVDLHYLREADVRYQLGHARPGLTAFASLGATCAEAVVLANAEHVA